MKRRTLLKHGGTATIVGLAGCTGGGSGGQETTTDETATTGETTTEATATETTEETETTTEASLSGTLKVATYSSFVDAPSSSPGGWLKQEFENRHPDVTVKYETPENEVNHYIQQAAQGVSIDTDVYVGMNVDHLIRIDEKLGQKSLFAPVADRLSHYGHVKDGLNFDPQQRAVPYDTGYISLVYDESKIQKQPETFQDLLKERYSGDLIVQNAKTAATGRAFLLWTVNTLGEDQYLDYWQKLKENGIKMLGSWSDAYTAYENGEAPMVVSYSTDQVYAHRQDKDLTKHRVGFLNDQGYANPEGMAKFAGTDKPELAEAFMDFMLSKQAQKQIAQLNVQYPATDWAPLGAEFKKYAKEPANPVTFTYEELQGNLDGWVDSWARQIAGGR
ncbi:thiamine ABC transporter substrate-binding protein [Halorussus gelatinilyticus]|uniref:Thiamine ABC transporter substrate-binding protein n=1 Tax=Halorussus gelatinilyticus TaxID=2937524 RepID=A0A8U0IN84_9EURY|nr:thiamine ABC transporter substrate-binding protein [Halorussus gelatinilyticus]UPW02036.1 thiamine ABC transporter substrate-binding protein [Halorussus gelatinilyticus]